jgi:Cdc6-like AAA superfamily ATPase
MRKLFGGGKVVILKIMGGKVVISVVPGGRLDICRSFNDVPIDMLSVHFSGRNSELEILEKNLRETSANQPSRCAVHGMPGLGKTQLALQYTKRFFDSRPNALVFWIPASSIEKVNQSFSKILNLVAHPDRRHPDQSARQIAARR